MCFWWRSTVADSKDANTRWNVAVSPVLSYITVFMMDDAVLRPGS